MSDIPNWEEIETLKAMGFRTLAERRQQLESTKKEAEAELKRVNTDIEAALIVAQVESVTYLHYKVTRRNQTSASKIEPTRLLEKGVPIETIDYATVAGTPYSFIEFRDMRPKPKKGGETFV